METNNPVLARMQKEASQNGGYAAFGPTTATATAAPADAAALQQMYDTSAPSSVGAPTTPMTITDVVAKTGVMFLLVFGFAYGAWQLEISTGIMVIAMLVGLGLGFWGALSKKVRPLVFLAYASVQGVFLGGISFWYTQFVAEGKAVGDEPNIVAQAVIGTFAAFAAMLFLYTTRIIKVTGTFKKAMMIGMLAYLGIAVASLIASFFGVGEGFGFYGAGGLGLLLCVAGVGLAAFSLALDFDAIETAVAAGVPERESWRAAFGLMVTLIWLYLELLRLLAILNRS
jgi:uncharacterized YccA/Bax inhibitor family protein